MSLVTYERDGYVGFLTLNRPEKRNALSLETWNAVGQATALAAADAEVRAIILRGAGKAFCAGLDLSPANEVIALLSQPASAAQKAQFYKLVRRLQKIHDDLESLPVPVIAAIHGPCLGAGLELALCADFRLCSADAVFGLPEARLAIITDVGGLQRLPKVVGAGHAREIAYRGHTFRSDKAKAIGLVNDVYPDPETMQREALRIAREIAGNPPLAVQGAKRVLQYNETTDMDRSQDYNAARSAMIMPSDDLFEAVSAFMEKRAGNYKGS